MSVGTIQWTEALVDQEELTPAALLLSLLLLAFSLVANSLAAAVHLVADSAPLDTTVVRTPLKEFAAARRLGYTFPSHFFQPPGQPRLHYLSEGSPSSPTLLLLLHGEPFWSQAWTKVIPPLASEHWLVVPDMIGFGLSDKWVDHRQYSLARHADSILQLLDSLGIGQGQQVVLVGHNWGWMVGAEVARRRPHLFHRLVILNTNNLPDGEAQLARFSSTSKWAKFQVMNAWFLAFRASMNLLRSWFPLQLLLHSLNSSYSREEVAAFASPWPSPRYCGGTTAFPLMVPVLPSHPEAPGMARLRGFLSTWRAPALVLYSQAALLPWLQAGDFVVGNRRPFYRLLVPGVVREAVVGGSGHLVMWDRPEVVVREIRAFLSS